jgi:hypothetical protein
VVQRLHKATGGLIRAEFVVNDGRYREVAISGDYFCFPKDIVDRLAMEIEGSKLEQLVQVVNNFYKRGNFELPGIGADDWIKVFKI